MNISSTKLWIKHENLWHKGLLQEIRNDKYYVQFDSSSKNQVILNNFYSKDNIATRNEDEVDNVNNLIDIPHLNEPSILNASELRYSNDDIYTYTGNILLAINPFKQLDLYSDKHIHNYSKSKSSKSSNSSLAPHIYQIAEKAYQQLLDFDRNQSILISGESGAGKTQSTKIIMRYLTNITSKNSEIEDKIISSNPILEAFGNAKTIRNNNSSRFGKFIKLQFDVNHKMTGAEIDTYLLEKIRLIGQNKGERNFHIFYQLLSGLPTNKLLEYGLQQTKEYHYLSDDSQLGGFVGLGLDDKADYQKTINAMKTMNFSETEIDCIIRIVIAILHLGNFDYNNQDITDTNNPNTLDIVCKLLKMSKQQQLLLEIALTHRHIETKTEKYTIQLTKAECLKSRDSLAMKLYSNMFDNIVAKINTSINNTNTNTKTGSTNHNLKTISILDIFGFECLEKNSFEQLCINYTNESLQQQFNKYIFKLEQEEYKSEGIYWEDIEFIDNQPCIDLIEGNKGLFRILDEECMVPNGSDKNFTRKVQNHFKKNDYFYHEPKYLDEKIGIAHYAGVVNYMTDGFKNKNMDLVSNEVIDFIKSFITTNNTDKNYGFNNWLVCGDDKQITSSISRIKINSINSKFKSQLHELLSFINKTETQYIRCLKPNDTDEANNLNRLRILEQLRYSGVLEAVRVARAGYPIRFKHHDFVLRYKAVGSVMDAILPHSEVTGKYQRGHTKIFLKNDTYEQLEDLRIKLLATHAVAIQKHIRGFIQKSKYQKIRIKIIQIQSFIRMVHAIKHTQQLREYVNATKIQSQMRCYLATCRYLRFRRIIILLQCRNRFRIHLQRVSASRVIQQIYREYQKQELEKLQSKSVVKIQKLAKQYLRYQRTLSAKLARLQREQAKMMKLQVDQQRKEQKQIELKKQRQQEEQKREEQECQRMEQEHIVQIMVQKMEQEKNQELEVIRRIAEEKEKEAQANAKLIKVKNLEIEEKEQLLKKREEQLKRRMEEMTKMRTDLNVFKECVSRDMENKINMYNQIERVQREKNILRARLLDEKNKSFMDKIKDSFGLL
jgi:myosin V